MNALNRIVENTLEVVSSRKRDRVYVSGIKKRLDVAKKTLPLVKVLGGNSIIAEVKFASPSAGDISTSEVVDVVEGYVKGGAAAISVLTEEKYFKGGVGFLEVAKTVSRLPILRKDFLLDEFQLDEARAFGADGVLLISSLLGDKLEGMLDYASSLGLWCLVEVHGADEIGNVLDAGAEIIGINNRDLSSLNVDLGTTTAFLPSLRSGKKPGEKHTRIRMCGVSSRFAGFKPPDLGTTIKLCKLIPKNKTLVTESGINNPEDIKKLKQKCQRKPDFYLIGTSLMKSEDRARKLRELIKA